MGIRILSLEDNAVDAELVERELLRGGLSAVVRRVQTREEFERILASEPPDLIVADHNVPQYTGREALAYAKAVVPDVPFILVTGSLSDEIAVEYMKAGATDYVLKDRLSRLGSAARAALENKRQKEEEKRLREQLYLAQRVESVGRLAGGVAHDFNNLLTVVLGNADLMLAHLDSTEMAPEYVEALKRPVQEIRLVGERAAQLTRQLLALGRRQVLEPRVLDLGGLVTRLEPMLHRVLREDIVVTTSTMPGLWKVRADPNQIEQVLMNLVVNARDAMPQGGRLSIETANVDLNAELTPFNAATKPGPYVMMAVSDTGIGMTKEVRDSVFEPFFTTKEASNGTGLGLATAYGIVKQSGGYIWVDSEVGNGTVFKVLLPRLETDSEEVPEERVEEQPLRGSETILVVEDEDRVRDLVSKVLESQGYTVLTASSTQEALSLIGSRQGVELLLTDVVLPDGSGPEMASQMVERSQNLRILYMSGYAGGTVLESRALDSGTAYLQKPFTSADLTRKVRQVLDSH